jgi:hypothetical protein
VSEGLLRIAAITNADFRIRFRRASTAAIFLGLCIAAYLWIPDPSTGKALIQMNDQRALYNSPALAMATAALCNILLGLIGYYMVSNSIGRDTRTRTGFVIASTNVRNWEYLTGIFFGNLIFLSVVVFGFMLSCMVMQMIRGEAPLDVLAFARQYGILIPPMVVFVSAIAVLFESVRWLSGRFGDLLYFFVWLGVLAFVAVAAEKAGGKTWQSNFDTFSFAFMEQGVEEITHSHGFSIGSTSFDQKKPPFVFPGLRVTSAWFSARIISTLYPLFLIPLALVFFNRFNPMKVKASQVGNKRSVLARANALIRPVTVPLFSLAGSFSSKPTLFHAVLSEILLTLQLYPLTVFLLAASLVASVVTSTITLQHVVLPTMFVAVALILSDVPTRERKSGTTGMIESMPLLKPNFVWWKLCTACTLVLIFTLIPFLRLLMVQPSAALSLLIGSLFVASCAITLGLTTGNPKTFIVSFLLFLYVVMNDGGKNPGFDFAGWFGTATRMVQVEYSILTLATIAVSVGFYRWQQRFR